MGKNTPTPNTVLVIRAIHDAQSRAYKYEPAEVAKDTAEEQLSKEEANRNYHWRAVRYASEEEYKEYYGIKDKPAVNETVVADSETKGHETSTDETAPAKRGRKAKEVVNE
jgi:hypothetical protein